MCAGLRQFLSADELRDRMVCVVANLKPAKLAGQVRQHSLACRSALVDKCRQMRKRFELASAAHALPACEPGR